MPQLDDTKRYKNPGIAALLSFFIPGAGQVYSERIFRGIVYFLISGFFATSAFIQDNVRTMGILVLIWVINIFDAHFCARLFNNPENFPQKYEPSKKASQ